MQRRWEALPAAGALRCLRIALLWKFGGIYLDTDFIVLKDLRNLTNALGTQSRYVLNGAFLALAAPTREFMAQCMRDRGHYNGWIWGHQGRSCSRGSSEMVLHPQCGEPRLQRRHHPCPRGLLPHPLAGNWKAPKTSVPRADPATQCHLRGPRVQNKKSQNLGTLRPRQGPPGPAPLPATAPRRTRP